MSAAPRRRRFADEPVEPQTEPAAMPSEPAAAGERRVRKRTVTFPIGVDYYPLDAERSGFDDWYGGDIEADIAAFGAARLSLVRVFISWKMFEQQVGNYDEEASQRLDRLVAAARGAGVQLIVCLFADDRLAELSDVTWGRKRDPRTDPYLIQREVSLVQRIVQLYRGERSIFAWDLANEAFCAGFRDPKSFEAWVRTMREAIREIDADHPILVSVDPETLLRSTGVDPRGAIDSCELAVSHVLPGYQAYAADGPVTSGPPTYVRSFLLRSARRDLPVLAEGVGVSSLEYSAAQEAAVVRTGLYSALMNRAAGVLLRRWRDVETENREPYYRDPYETLVGLHDIDGEPKPALAEVERFARVASRLDLRRFVPQAERTAIMLPAERYDPLPSMAGLYDPRACLQAFIAAKEAHVPVDLIRESDPLDAFGVVIVPAAGRLQPGTWRDLTSYVQGGGSLVMSYGGGDAEPAARDLFGVDFLGDHGRRSSLSCRVAQPDTLKPLRSFDARLELPHYALLTARTATVVATDAKGSPLVTVNAYGSGRAVFIAAPVERALAQGDAWAAAPEARELARSVYGAVARSAGAASPVSCDRPEVELALFAGDAEDALLLLNHCPDDLVATVTTDRAVASVADLRGGEAAAVGGHEFGVPLGGNGVAALRIVWA